MRECDLSINVCCTQKKVREQRKIISLWNNAADLGSWDFFFFYSVSVAFVSILDC